MSEEPKIRPLSPELQARACKELNEDPKRRAADIAHIREWLSKQPHILGKPDDQTILAFLRGCKFSLERTKEKMDMYYTVRGAVPEFFQDRNVRDQKFKALIETMTFFPLPNLDPEGHRVLVIRPGIPDPNVYSLQEYIKMNFMLMDVLIREDDALLINGVVSLIDVAGASFSFASQFTPTLAKKTFVCSQEGFPLRPKGVNYINTPSIFSPFMNLVKSLTKEKIRKRLLIHGDDLSSLYKHIPQHMLPTEYGGQAGSMKEINDAWLKKVDSYYDWFLKDTQIKVDESKRPGKPKTHEQLFGLEGSFRQLEVD